MIQNEARSSLFDPEAFKAAVFGIFEKERMDLLLHHSVIEEMSQGNKDVFEQF